MCDGPDLFLCVLSVLFPPIGVWIKRGICSADSLINILLCMLGYLPGLIHAWYIICSYPDAYERIPESDEAHVHVYYVRPGGAGGPPPSAGPPPGGHSSPQVPTGSYGTISSQPQPRTLPPSSQPQAGSSSHGEQPTTSAVAAKVAGADLPSGNVQDGGPAEASGADGPPPPSYADAVRGNNKIQSHE